MTNHNASPASPAPAIKPSSWSDFAIQDAVAKLPLNSGAAAITEMMTKLAVKLAAIREYEKWDPRAMDSIVLKSGYQVVETLTHRRSVLCLQALPDGRIVSGSADQTLRTWGKNPNGDWINEVLTGHTSWVGCLQALPDGRIVSGSIDKTLRIWSKEPNATWTSEVLKDHTQLVRCLQALPDGRIVSVSYDATLRIWSKAPNGDWCSEVLNGHTHEVICLQALPDGRIVSGSRRPYAPHLEQRAPR